MVDEVGQPQALEEGDAPAVVVGVGAATPLRKTGKAERHVGRRVAVHSEQLAHKADYCAGGSPWGPPRNCQAASTAMPQIAASIRNDSSKAASRALLVAPARLAPCASSRHSSTIAHRLTP